MGHVNICSPFACDQMKAAGQAPTGSDIFGRLLGHIIVACCCRVVSPVFFFLAVRVEISTPINNRNKNNSESQQQ